MREIIFRGKRVDNGEWAESPYPYGTMSGGVVQHDFISQTLGQFTGLTDKNGVKIFEGDILKISEGNDEDDYVIKKVYAYRGVLCVDYWTPDWDFNALAFLDNDNGYVFEIIGNIYDNPELLEYMDIKPAAKMSDTPAEQLGLAPAT